MTEILGQENFGRISFSIEGPKHKFGESLGNLWMTTSVNYMP